ncbi:MAG: hypothetical protein AAFN09_02280 [Pseudomonadota bacterium]
MHARYPRLLRATLGDIWRAPGAARLAMLPAFVLLSLSHAYYRSVRENWVGGLLEGFFVHEDRNIVLALGLWPLCLCMAVGWIAVIWQQHVLGAVPAGRPRPARVLRYGAEWAWRSALMGAFVLAWLHALSRSDIGQIAMFVTAEHFLLGQLFQHDVAMNRIFEMTMIISSGMNVIIILPILLYFWLRMALGLPSYVAEGKPLSLAASWRRTRGMSRALWRAAFAGTALWLVIKALTWGLSTVASFGMSPGLDVNWMFAARVAVPPLSTILIQLIVAGLLAQVYLATEPDPAELF